MDAMNLRRPEMWIHLFLLAFFVMCSFPAAAEQANGPSTDDGALDLFDDDVETKETGWPLFSIAFGAAWLDADGVLGARPPSSPPITIIDFDRVGLDESDRSHWLTMTWRSRTSRWGAWFGNWRYDVSGSRSWDREWPFDGGQSVPVGAAVESSFDANWYIAEATYSFVQNNTIDMGIGFGFHIVDLSTDLRVRVSVGEGEVEVVNGDLDTLAPLPNILGYLHWNIHPRWEAIARMGWFGLSYDIYDGQMTNAHVMINFSISDRFTLGAGYQFVSLDLDIERKRYTEIYDIDFYGPMAFARIWF